MVVSRREDPSALPNLAEGSNLGNVVATDGVYQFNDLYRSELASFDDIFICGEEEVGDAVEVACSISTLA